MTNPMHCPGHEQFKNLKSFTCKCPNCGKEKEIFSDEFDKKHVCKGAIRRSISPDALSLPAEAPILTPR